MRRCCACADSVSPMQLLQYLRDCYRIADALKYLFGQMRRPAPRRRPAFDGVTTRVVPANAGTHTPCRRDLAVG